MDIVNPIPPSMPAPNNPFQLIPLGKAQIPVFTKIKLKRVIPIGFPTMSPSRIPCAKGSPTCWANVPKCSKT